MNDLKRDAIIQEMVEAGDLISLGDDFYEDMGGHILHESNLDEYGYIEDFLKRQENEQ